MMNKQHPVLFYGYKGKLIIFMFILCFSLFSCSTTKENEQHEREQAQHELKPSVTHEKKIPSSAKNIQQDTSAQVKNGNEKPLQQDGQQQTNAGNYPSEIKSARTAQEKTAQLEGKLNASLRNFDEMLLKENEELSVLSRREEGIEGGGAASQGGAESGLGEHNGGSVAASGGSGQSIAGAMSQDRDFDNDDVVARQIREAAEKESDPELKKKLWAEYKKYKAGNK